MLWRALLCSLVALIVALPPASAQITFAEHQKQLMRMAEIMGSLYHLRTLCDRDDDQLWRNNVKRLMDLEQLPADVRQQMTTRFNDSFAQQERAYSRCNRKATDEIERLAREGQRLADTMARQF